MPDRARVLSIDTLLDAKAAMIEFAESINITLTSVDSDINRVSYWLTHDRPNHWKREVRKREEAVEEAKGAIMRKKIIAAPDPAPISEEQKLLQVAKVRLFEAEKKLAAVRRWAPTFEREALLYKGSCRGLTETLHRDVPIATARLDRMVASLEAYARIAPPRGDLESAERPDSSDTALHAAPEPNESKGDQPPDPPTGPIPGAAP
jgi:hypothetical protein